MATVDTRRDQPGARESRGSAQRSVRLLVVADDVLSAQELEREIHKHAAGRTPEVRVVFPALTKSPIKRAMGDVDEAIAAATERAHRQLDEASGEDWNLEVAIGDSDPFLAIDDGLRIFPADEVLIVAHPDRKPAWMERDLLDRLRDREHPAATYVVVEDTGPRDVQHVDAGSPTTDQANVASRSANMPRYSLRDVGGIAVAIFGTVALAVIASACPGGIAQEGGTSTACVAELLIAGGMALINVAHVIGLTLFTATRYRGIGERIFAWFSLIGTPLAIVATLVISATN